jgi:hypothetical protein
MGLEWWGAKLSASRLVPVVLQHCTSRRLIIVLLGLAMPSALGALALLRHPNEHGSQRPILLALDQEFAAGGPARRRD